jgi:hypothetical protein
VEEFPVFRQCLTSEDDTAIIRNLWLWLSYNLIREEAGAPEAALESFF